MLNVNELEKIIIDLKKKYENIFATTIGNKLFVWRLITRKEYEIIIKSSAGNKLLREDLICQAAVLYPKVDFLLYKAGIPSSLANQIIEESGFGSTNKSIEFLTNKRENIAENFTLQAEIAIVSAFPQYKFEDLKEWDIEKLLDMLSKAEWKFNNIDNIEFKFEFVEQDEKEKTVENESTITKLNKTAKNLAKLGIDPIMVLGESFKEAYKKPEISFPLIMGKNWDNEEVLNVIRESLHK